MCGWDTPTHSHAEHVVEVYEMSVLETAQLSEEKKELREDIDKIREDIQKLREDLGK